MIEHQINLLPPPVREERTARVYLNRVGRLLRVAAGMLLLLLLAQAAGGGAYLYAQRSLRADDAGGMEIASETRQLIASKNGTLGLADRWLQYYQPWTPLFRGMLAAVPSNIALTSIQLDEKTGALNIQGSVSTRVDVVNFRRQLEELEWVESVDAPLSNFETGDEASFSFAVKRQ
ncbi:hypothetical protein CL628_02535 [bacterium]|nr:hypothetical protein [bacterium]